MNKNSLKKLIEMTNIDLLTDGDDENGNAYERNFKKFFEEADNESRTVMCQLLLDIGYEGVMLNHYNSMPLWGVKSYNKEMSIQEKAQEYKDSEISKLYKNIRFLEGRSLRALMDAAILSSKINQSHVKNLVFPDINMLVDEIDWPYLPSVMKKVGNLISGLTTGNKIHSPGFIDPYKNIIISKIKNITPEDIIRKEYQQRSVQSTDISTAGVNELFKMVDYECVDKVVELLKIANEGGLTNKNSSIRSVMLSKSFDVNMHSAFVEIVTKYDKDNERGKIDYLMEQLGFKEIIKNDINFVDEKLCVEINWMKNSFLIVAMKGVNNKGDVLKDLGYDDLVNVNKLLYEDKISEKFKYIRKYINQIEPAWENDISVSSHNKFLYIEVNPKNKDCDVIYKMLKEIVPNLYENCDLTENAEWQIESLVNDYLMRNDQKMSEEIPHLVKHKVRKL